MKQLTKLIDIINTEEFAKEFIDLNVCEINIQSDTMYRGRNVKISITKVYS